MNELLQNLDKDIATVRGYLEKLKSGKSGLSSSNVLRAKEVYTDMLYQLMDLRRDLRKYTEEGDK